MIRQPERGSRNVSELFYIDEKKNIERLNKLFENIPITQSEERALIWLAGWEDDVVANITSAFCKLSMTEPEKLKADEKLKRKKEREER